MRSKEELENLLNSSKKEIEKKLNVRIVNGQGYTAIKKAINWALGNENESLISVSQKYGGGGLNV